MPHEHEHVRLQDPLGYLKEDLNKLMNHAPKKKGNSSLKCQVARLLEWEEGHRE
jgi:hypothetical protein